MTAVDLLTTPSGWASKWMRDCLSGLRGHSLAQAANLHLILANEEDSAKPDGRKR